MKMMARERHQLLHPHEDIGRAKPGGGRKPTPATAQLSKRQLVEQSCKVLVLVFDACRLAALVNALRGSARDVVGTADGDGALNFEELHDFIGDGHVAGFGTTWELVV